MSSHRSRRRFTVIPAAYVAPVAVMLSVMVLPSSSGTAASLSSLRNVGPGESAELRQAAQRLEVCSAKNVSGVGLRGEYFADPQLQGRALLVRVDPSIDFNADLDWPDREAATRPRSVRWSGWIKPPISGRYRFHFSVPGGRVFVSQQGLVGPSAAPDASIELAAGRFYPVRVELDLAAATVEGPVRLAWTAPYGARYLIPRSLLYLPSEPAVVARQ